MEENNVSLPFALLPETGQKPQAVPTTPMQYVANSIKMKSELPQYLIDYRQQSGANSLDAFKDDRIKLTNYDVDIDDTHTRLSDGTYISRYKNYIPGTDNETRLAKEETLTEKWGNGFAKLGLKTLTATVGGTVGVADSLLTLITTGSLSDATNSSVNRYLDDVNKMLDYKLPNYYTAQEKELSIGAQLGTANFWADTVFGGLSFTAGAIISGGIWGAASGGVGLLTQESKLAQLAKWTVGGVGGEAKALQTLNAAKAVASKPALNTLIGEVATISNEAMGSAIAGNKIKRAADIAYVALRSAGYESAMESRQYMNATEHAWMEKYQKENGVLPTGAEYAEFKDGLTTSANWVFAANMAIVGSSNMAQFGRVLMGKSVASTVTNNSLKRSLFGIGYDAVGVEGNTVLKEIAATKAQKVAGRLYGILGASLPEGAEEMGQRFTTVTAENYILNAYDSDKTKATYGIAEALGGAFKDTFGTKEGLKEGVVGAIVGILGGGAHTGFKFGQISEERAQVKQQVDYSNGFTANNHLQNLIANNRLQGTEQDKQQAIKNNDLPGELLADTASSLALLDRNSAIGGIEEGITFLSAQIRAVKNDELAKDLGLGTGEEAEKQAAEFKEQKIAQHIALARLHKKSEDYATALLGNVEIAGLDKDVNLRQIKNAIAYSITMGKEALRINSDLVGHTKTMVAEGLTYDHAKGVSDAMTVQQILDLAPVEIVANLKMLSKAGANLKSKMQTLEANIVKAASMTQDDNNDRNAKLIELNKQLEETQAEINNNNNEKQIALDAAGISQYTNENVTWEMLDKQDKNVESLKKTLQNIQTSDPARFQELSKLLQAQSKAIRHIKNYDRVSKGIANKETRVKVINGWLSKILEKNTKLNDTTSGLFSDVLKSWSDDTKITKQDSDNNQRDTTAKREKSADTPSEEYVNLLLDKVQKDEPLRPAEIEFLDALSEANINDAVETPTVAQPYISEIQRLKNRVSEIINGENYYANYLGKDFAQKQMNKPDSKDIERYAELLAKINRKLELKIVSKMLIRDASFYKDRNIGLTEAEINEFKELNVKLNDWNLIQGMSASDTETVADLIELINSLSQTISEQETKVELVDNDYEALTKEGALGTDVDVTAVRGASIPLQALATPMDNGTTLRFSHSTFEQFVSFFPTATTLTDRNEDTFEIVLEDGSTLWGIFNNRGGIDVSLRDWKDIEEKSNIIIKNFGTNSSALNQRVGNTDEWQIVVGDASFLQTDGSNMELNQEEINKIKAGDTIDLAVSTTDQFNADTELLRQQIEENKDILSEEDLEILEEQLKVRDGAYHIYLMVNGKLVGSLPANYSTEKPAGVGMNLLELRKSAKKFVKKNGGAGIIKLNNKVDATIVRIGQPNLTIEKKDGQEPQVLQNEFTKEALQHVVGQGYILNGEITSTTDKIDVRQFIQDVSGKNKDKKVPFVIFMDNGKTVAFPINLTKFATSVGADVEAVLNSDVKTTVKSIALVDALIQNGFNPEDYEISFSDNSQWDNEQGEIKRAVQDLKGVTISTPIEDFAKKGYKKEQLSNDATIGIRIDDVPFLSPKVMISVSKKVYNDVVDFAEQKQDVDQALQQVKQDLADIAIVLKRHLFDNSADYVNSNGSEIEGKYIDAITDVEQNSKGVNKNIAQLLLAVTKTDAKGKRIVSVTAQITKIIGADIVNDIKELLKKDLELRAISVDLRSELAKEVSEQVEDLTDEQFENIVETNEVPQNVIETIAEKQAFEEHLTEKESFVAEVVAPEEVKQAVEVIIAPKKEEAIKQVSKKSAGNSVGGDISKMNQSEFAQWIQDNKNYLRSIERESISMSGNKITVKPFKNQYYDLLTVRPEHRKQFIENKGVLSEVDFNEAREYYRTLQQEESKYSNSDSNPDWLQFNFGNTNNTEVDGNRRKGYITISENSIDNFKGNISKLIAELNKALEGNYNGSFKIAQKLGTLKNQFDNIVVHGANTKEVQNALNIINKTLLKSGVDNKISQIGIDGKNKKGDKTSHTRLLEEKIQNNELVKAVEQSLKEQTKAEQVNIKPQTEPTKTKAKENTEITLISRIGDKMKFVLINGKWQTFSTRKEWLPASKNEITRIEQELEISGEWTNPATESDLALIKAGKWQNATSVQAITEALNNNRFQQAVINNRMTPERAIEIIESAGLEVPKIISGAINGIKELNDEKNSPNSCA